jgi:hypothetical protein
VRVLAPGGVAEVQVLVGFGNFRGFVHAFLPRPLLKRYSMKRHGLFYTTSFPIRARRVDRIIAENGGKVVESRRENIHPAGLIRSYVILKVH